MKDVKVQSFLKYLSSNSNLRRLTTNFDNIRAPIHRWFPFLVGFSHNLVKETIRFFNNNGKDFLVFDPFIGSGTTAVVGKEIGVNVIGNEINRFLLDICRIKISVDGKLKKDLIREGKKLINEVSRKWEDVSLSDEHKILIKCFPENNLKKLVALREHIRNSDLDERTKGYFFIALTRSLNKSAKVGLNVPYISWSHKRKPEDSFTVFLQNVKLIVEDLKLFSNIAKNSSEVKVYLHDSRKKNRKIEKSSIDMVFTSPPYLNNFDYGESLKVFLYFWKYVKDWSEITSKIRRVSVASATTYYNEKKLINKSPEKILGKDFMNTIPSIAEEIISKAEQIRIEKNKRKFASKKSFELLTLLYFKDMFSVLKELLRVLKENSLSFIVIGDSAPYGVHIKTDVLLGEIAIGIGFSSYTVQPLRERGIKWRNLKYRHKLRLRESLLILRR